MPSPGHYPDIDVSSAESTFGLEPSNPKVPYEIQTSEVQSDQNPLEFQIVITETVHDDCFGKVQISIKNTSEGPITVRFGVTPPFSSYVGSDTSNNTKNQKSEPARLSNPTDRLYLIPLCSDDSIINKDLLPDSASDNLWRVTTHIDVPQIGNRQILTSDEMLSREYAILAPSQEELSKSDIPPNSCGLIPGEYMFEENYIIVNNDASSENKWVNLRFTLKIE